MKLKTRCVGEVLIKLQTAQMMDGQFVVYSEKLYSLMRIRSWQLLQDSPTLPNCALIKLTSPVAATFASSLAASLKVFATFVTSSFFWKNSGFKRVCFQPMPWSVPSPYRAPKPELATAAIALAAAETVSLL